MKRKERPTLNRRTSSGVPKRSFRGFLKLVDSGKAMHSLRGENRYRN